MNVSLSNNQEKYIASQIEAGDYQNASELMRDALRMEIEKGWEAPVSGRSVQDIIKAKTQ
ncbi:ribbon-helix-helix domain-containing protein [Roseivirga sp.]|uniref:ribbon-helix-helix domain-containing protein n=1 Tax=Roseivirga sp. TaxID=1964215 RepID=UPI002B2708C2|nr:type II toxin-antitoxin system ParD family antitoxin [Roseivirga sp.]